jgi:uncharacterized membrane protein YobD (UPF0266 family)
MTAPVDPQPVENDALFGRELGFYPVDRARLLLPAGIIVLLIGLVLNFTIAEVDPWGPPVTTLVTAAVSLLAGWWVLHQWNREVTLYENGFTYREGSKTVFFTYAEIRSFRLRAERLLYFGGLLRRTVHRFTLLTNKDETIVLTGLYRRIAELGDRLEAQVVAAQRTIAVERLERGERLPFSDTLMLSQAGLHESGRDLPWAALAGWKVERGALVLLEGQSEWFRLRLPEVDNLALLIGLLKERRG